MYDLVMADASSYYEKREAELGAATMRDVERQVMLRIIDQRWREHLDEMDYLQEGINLRAMGQKDPLTEWQREGFEMFGSMMKGIAQDFVKYVMHVQVVRKEAPAPVVQNVQQTSSDDVLGQRLHQRRQGRDGRRRRRARGCRRGRRRSSAGAHEAADRRQGRVVEDAAQRPVPVRQWQEVQAVPRRAMRDFSDELKELRRRLGEAEGYLKVDANRLRLKELEIEVARPDLWDDQEAAKKLTAEYSNIKGDIDAFDSLTQQLDDTELLHEMAREMDDESQEPDIAAATEAISSQLRQLELRSLFTGEHDELDCIVQINAEGRRRRRPGLGRDPAAHVLAAGPSGAASASRSTTISPATEAGIMSAEFTLTGRYAYGLMTSERGTHRLVRISPFDNQGRRQTSFAAVQVWPVMDAPDVEIERERHRDAGLPGQRRRWSARQQDVVRRAPDPPAHRPRGEQPGGAQPAPEP